MKKSVITVGLLIFCLLFAYITPIEGVTYGKTYYVSTSGSNYNSGTITSPFKTIQKAIDVAVAGDTVYIRGGTYNQKLVMKNSGVLGKPITISGYPSETAIIDGKGINYWLGLIYLNGKDYLTFNNLKIQNSVTHGIFTGEGTYGAATSPCNDITIKNCRFYHIYRYAIAIDAYSPTNPCYRIKVDHCTFEDIEYKYHSGGATEECVGFGNCKDVTFTYNTMKHLHKIGVDFGTCQNCVCSYNDIDTTGMSTEACGIYVIGGHSYGYRVNGVTISNNYVHGNRQGIMFANERSNTYISNMVIKNNVVQVTSGSYAGISQFNMNMPNYYENIKITDNTIKTSGGYCIRLEASSSYMKNLVISNNVMNGRISVRAAYSS